MSIFEIQNDIDFETKRSVLVSLFDSNGTSRKPEIDIEIDEDLAPPLPISSVPGCRSCLKAIKAAAGCVRLIDFRRR